MFIIYQGQSFGSFYLEIELVVFVYELIMKLFLLLGYVNSTSDLQPSTAVANQLPGQIASTQIRTIGLNCFMFIIALIVPSTKIV